MLYGVDEAANALRLSRSVFYELIRYGLSAHDDPRRVVADPDAQYFGTALGDAALLPGEDAQLGETRFEDWLSQPAIAG